MVESESEPLSVLSVEPYGMKQDADTMDGLNIHAFSALGRAVWDETRSPPWMIGSSAAFSALGRAVWDETGWDDLRAVRG